MAEVKYRMSGSEPTRKLRYQVGAGLPGGGALALVLAYILGRIDPQMPPEILAVAAGLLATALTGGAMALVGWMTRPAAQDRPEIDPTAAATPPAGIP